MMDYHVGDVDSIRAVGEAVEEAEREVERGR